MVGDDAGSNQGLRLIAAAFTAFDDAGRLRLDAIEEQAAALLVQGVDGVFVCGSTGEGPSMSTAERLAVAERWARVGSGLDLIVHVGHASLPDARALAAGAQDVGASGIAACAPYYFPPTDLLALVDFCAAVADAASELPFLYYHFPARTQVALDVPELISLATERIPTFAGVKFTSPDLLGMARSVEACTEGVSVLSGPDELLLQALTGGVRAAVGSTYNFFAPHYRRMYAAYRTGQVREAERLQARLRGVVDVVAGHGGLAALKAMTSWFSIDCGPCRLPLRGLNPAARKALRDAIDKAGLSELLTPPD